MKHAMATPTAKRIAISLLSFNKKSIENERKNTSTTIYKFNLAREKHISTFKFD